MSQAPSRIQKIILISLGTSCVGLGLVGAVIPLVPTTPFLLIAAACYARASQRLYRRLLSHRIFGTIIYEWRTHRSMPRSAKRVAIIAIVVTFSLSTYLNIQRPFVWIPLALFGAGLCVFISRISSREGQG